MYPSLKAEIATRDGDLRLSLLLGIAAWFLFLDHIPHDVVSWLTLRNYGFSDAAEFFVFISGYLVGFIYTPVVRGGLFLAALKRLWKRAGQLYIAHHWTPETERLANELVEDLRAAYADKIDHAPWMDDATKQAALEKARPYLLTLGNKKLAMR